MEIKMKDVLTFVEQKVRRIAQLEHLNYELDGDLTNSQIENEKLKKQIEELTDKLNESNRDLKVLTKQLDEQFSLSEILKSKLSESCRKVETLKETGTNLYNENITLKKDIELLKSTIKCQNNEITLLKQENTEVTDLQQEIDYLKSENKKLVLEIERKDILLNDTELTIQSFTSNKESFDKLSIENQELVLSNELNKNRIDRYETELAKLIEGFEQGYIKNKESFDKSSIENQELKQENGIWINEIKDLQIQNKELKQEIESFRKLNAQDLISKNQTELIESLKEQLENDFSIHDSTHYNKIIFFHENEIDVKDKDFFSKSIELLTESIMKIVRIYY